MNISRLKIVKREAVR